MHDVVFWLLMILCYFLALLRLRGAQACARFACYVGGFSFGLGSPLHVRLFIFGFGSPLHEHLFIIGGAAGACKSNIWLQNLWLAA